MSTLALHHILVKSPLLAEELLAELKLGADFGDLAAEYSTCPSANNQGFAGYHSSDALPAALVHALYNEGGTYIGPVATQFGYHIMKASGRPDRPMIVEDL